jgi:hypothetical protein
MDHARFAGDIEPPAELEVVIRIARTWMVQFYLDSGAEDEAALADEDLRDGMKERDVARRWLQSHST